MTTTTVTDRHTSVADRDERDAAICKRIAAARTAAGFTQEEFAALLEVIPRTVQLYESTRVPWKELATIARLTGRPLEWFLRGDEAYEDGDVRAAIRRELAASERHILDRVNARIDNIEGIVNGTAEMVRDLLAAVRDRAS